MENGFELPVMYNNAELLFPARLIKAGFQYKFEVEVNELNVLFEPDEEMRYRAVLPHGTDASGQMKPALLQAIAETIEEFVQ